MNLWAGIFAFVGVLDEGVAAWGEAVVSYSAIYCVSIIVANISKREVLNVINLLRQLFHVVAQKDPCLVDECVWDVEIRISEYSNSDLCV